MPLLIYFLKVYFKSRIRSESEISASLLSHVGVGAQPRGPATLAGIYMGNAVAKLSLVSYGMLASQVAALLAKPQCCPWGTELNSVLQLKD